MDQLHTSGCRVLQALTRAGVVTPSLSTALLGTRCGPARGQTLGEVLAHQCAALTLPRPSLWPLVAKHRLLSILGLKLSKVPKSTITFMACHLGCLRFRNILIPRAEHRLCHVAYKAGHVVCLVVPLLMILVLSSSPHTEKCVPR
jgi:hypothetical protein